MYPKGARVLRGHPDLNEGLAVLQAQDFQQFGGPASAHNRLDVSVAVETSSAFLLLNPETPRAEGAYPAKTPGNWAVQRVERLAPLVRVKASLLARLKGAMWWEIALDG